MINIYRLFLVCFLLACGLSFYYFVDKSFGAGVLVGLSLYLVWCKDDLFDF